MKKESNRLATISVGLSALALALSWQANRISQASIQPQILVTAIGSNLSESRITEKSHNIFCEDKIRLVNTGGADTTLQAIEVEAQYENEKVKFRLTDFYGSGNLVNDILLSGKYSNKESSSPVLVAAHNSSDVIVTREVESDHNKHQLIKEIDYRWPGVIDLRRSFKELKMLYTLKFPDAKNVTIEAPPCAYVSTIDPQYWSIGDCVFCQLASHKKAADIYLVH